MEALEIWNIKFEIWNLLLKASLIIGLLGVCIQDCKERKVFVILLFITGILLSLFHFFQVESSSFFINIAVNSIFVVIIVSVLYIYSKYRLQKQLSKTLGAGDVVFFFIMGFSFPTISFLILFSFSIFFTGLLFFLLKKRINKKEIPLAGFQALFLVLVFLVNWAFQISNLYAF